MPRNRNGDHPEVNGFINLYKPSGITSMDALRRVKRITGQRRKVGHGGTMDPLARGVLPVCFGQATRLMDYVVGGAKRYLMQVKLGETTSTYDAEGEVLEKRETGGITRAQVEQALHPFLGLVQQKPPMYSAVKVGGQRLYKLARAGVEVERQPRPIEIYNITILECDTPNLTLDVECGKGAYMRTLAHDLGGALGCGGHVADLERLSCGAFHAETAMTPDQLERSINGAAGWQEHLLPVDWILKDLKALSIGPHAERYLRDGQRVSLNDSGTTAGYLEPYRAYSLDGRFLAVVRFDRPTNSWKPVKVFQTNTPSPYAPSRS